MNVTVRGDELPREVTGPRAAVVKRSAAVNAALVTLALALLALLASVTGRITVRDGKGWDGLDYAEMVEKGWDAGTANTALRPLIVVLNRPAFAALGDAVTAFRVMNYVYVALLSLGLCLLFDRYNSDVRAKVLLIINVFLSIAAVKYVAFYPTLIDAGAYAVLTLAVYFIVSGKRVAAALACVAAVLSREFGAAVVLFGVVRDLRLRVPVSRIAISYAPAAAAFVGWRLMVADTWGGASRGEMLPLARLLVNLQQWQDPVFAAFFVYFLLTVFGGVSLFVFGKFGLAIRHLRAEPEWVVFMGAILAAALAGSADMWRYLAYLLPATVVLFAVCAREIGLPRHRIGLAILICAATVVTQRPLQAIDLAAYFRDWFPYYVHIRNVPADAGELELWPLWGWRLMGAAALLWALSVFPALSRMNTMPVGRDVPEIRDS